MKNRIFYILTMAFVTLLLAGSNGSIAQTPRLQASNQQVQTLLNRLETNTDRFRRTMENTLNQSSINGTNREDRIMDLVNDFENSTNTLRSSFTARRTINNEVSDLLNNGAMINNFIVRNRISGTANTQWTYIRTDLDTLARYYGVTWNWNDRGIITPQPVVPYTGSDAQLRNLFARLETKTDVFKRQMDTALDRSAMNNSVREDSISNYIARFEEATDRLKERFDSRRSTGEDASEVLRRALYIDQFVTNNRLNRRAKNQWTSIRTDLNTLSSYYAVSWNWDQSLPSYPDNMDSRITGTFRLNRVRSENVSNSINTAVAQIPTNRRDRVRRNLERRLASPEMIAIEKRNRTITLASSNTPQVTFEADGVARSETNPRGRTVTTTASTNNDGLIVNYEGDRMNDFYVTFSPSGNNQLNVTRRIYLEEGNEQITVSSVYDRVNAVADWSAVNTSTGPINGDTTGTINDFYIPNGTRITASLREAIKTRVSQVGDRFTMEVTSPYQYQGAIIEGRVADAESSGRLTGRAKISLEFDTLRMNGRTYRFAGIIDSVTAEDGDTISVNNEGQVRDGSKTTQTATRAGIGAILGAVIGAIAGGGQGAAIGAGVGAGAGAGTVLISGRDNLELETGTTFSITATAPAGVVNRQ